MGVTGSPGSWLASRWLWPLAVTNLVANIAIVVTGGAVRLTASGLGCPTWPRCTEASYVVHPELGLHGAIEFGNRMLTFVLAAVAVLTVVAAWRAAHRGATRISVLIALGIPAQAVIGGVTVLTRLNPWVVAFHFLVSMAMIGLCVLLLARLRGGGPDPVSVGVRRTSLSVFVLGWVVLYLGTVVTGSGPHAGDLDAQRTGLDPQVASHVHAAAVYALVAMTLLLVLLLRRYRDAARARRAAGALLVLELAQGAVGFVQYYLGLPEPLVALHMLGAALLSAGLAWLMVSGSAAGPVRPRRTAATDTCSTSGRVASA